MSDPQQGPQGGVRLAGLDLLIVGPVHGDRQEHTLLGEPSALAGPADLLADAQQFVIDPGLTGEVCWHATNAVAGMIGCQPGDTRLLPTSRSEPP